MVGLFLESETMGFFLVSLSKLTRPLFGCFLAA
jgi:hypothetical protein